MPKTLTRIEYGRRVARAAAYIADHLDEDLSLERLAEVACFSPYHFHRIYRGLVGETVADTIRRQRLQRAANELARSDASIERVARRAGYGSVEAFTRAFSADHGQGPAGFRARRSAPSTSNGDDAMLEVTVKSFEGVTLAALDHRGDYAKIGRAFEQLAAWAGARGLFDRPRRMFALYHDDPETVPTAELRSQAGIEYDGPLDGSPRREVIRPAASRSLSTRDPMRSSSAPIGTSTGSGCRTRARRPTTGPPSRNTPTTRAVPRPRTC